MPRFVKLFWKRNIKVIFLSYYVSEDCFFALGMVYYPVL